MLFQVLPIFFFPKKPKHGAAGFSKCTVKKWCATYRRRVQYHGSIHLLTMFTCSVGATPLIVEQTDIDLFWGPKSFVDGMWSDHTWKSKRTRRTYSHECVHVWQTGTHTGALTHTCSVAEMKIDSSCYLRSPLHQSVTCSPPHHRFWSVSCHSLH